MLIAVDKLGFIFLRIFPFCYCFMLCFRFIICRRIFFIMGTLYIYRSCTMLVTTLPVPGLHFRCAAKVRLWRWLLNEYLFLLFTTFSSLGGGGTVFSGMHYNCTVNLIQICSEESGRSLRSSSSSSSVFICCCPLSRDGRIHPILELPITNKMDCYNAAFYSIGAALLFLSGE